jgi:hypothetical protein
MGASSNDWCHAFEPELERRQEVDSAINEEIQDRTLAALCNVLTYSTSIEYVTWIGLNMEEVVKQLNKYYDENLIKSN